MGLLSTIKKKYRDLDKAFGGYLPGGVSTVKTPTAYPSTPSVEVRYSPETGVIVTSKKSGSSTSSSPSKSGSTSSSGGKSGGRSKVTYETVTAYQRPKTGIVSEKLGLGKVASDLDLARGKLRTKQLRGTITQPESLLLQGLTVGSGVTEFAAGLIDQPEFALRVIKNPSLIKKLPTAIEEGGAEFGELLRVSPSEAFVRIGTELVLLKGTSKAIKTIKELAESKGAKFSKSYVGEAVPGKTLNIKTGTGKAINLDVVEKIPVERLEKQIQRAGKPTYAISSQADELLGLLERKKIIRKPIPGEESFTRETKTLLQKFDKGKITNAELFKLDQLVKKQGAKGILERSFFADPTGKIRPSRLGVKAQKEASLIDVLSGDVTYKRSKPQILLFDKADVEKLPKALNTIKNKLMAGKSLTQKESNKLLKFQLKRTGKFKPLGFLSPESEITLAPGELIKRKKKVGTTLINGRKVPIVQAEVYKPTKQIKSLMQRYYKGELTEKQISSLNKLLKKKTGLDYKLSYSTKVSGKYVSLKRLGISLTSSLNKFKKSKSLTQYQKKQLDKISKNISKLSKKKLTKSSSASLRKNISKLKKIVASSSKKVKSKPSKKKVRSPVSKKVSPYKRSKATSKKTSRPVSRKTSSPRSPKRRKAISKTSRPVIRKRIIPAATGSKPKKGKLRKQKPKVAYHVVEKRGKKFVRITKNPLRKKDAKDKLAARLDNKISRTAKLIEVKKPKKIGSIPRRESGYFNKMRKNLRNYKIRKGKKIKTPNTYIERKGKAVISSPGEKRQLMLNRLAKARKVKAMKNKKRKK